MAEILQAALAAELPGVLTSDIIDPINAILQEQGSDQTAVQVVAQGITSFLLSSDSPILEPFLQQNSTSQRQETIKAFLRMLDLRFETSRRLIKMIRSPQITKYSAFTAAKQVERHVTIHGPNPDLCKEAYGLDTDVFCKLLRALQERTDFGSTRYLSAEERLAIGLWFLTKAESNRQCCKEFGRNPEAVSQAIHDVVEALSSRTMMKWQFRTPKADDPYHPRYLRSEFKGFTGIVGGRRIGGRCVGHLDGTIIGMSPTGTPLARVKFWNKRWEGAAHDVDILREALKTGLNLPEGCYYLADAAYQNSRIIRRPYKYTRYHLQEWGSGRARPRNAKELFNRCHASLRNAIKRAFGVLKKKFKILQQGCNSGYSEAFQARVPVACMVLHNFNIRNQASSADINPALLRTGEDEEVLPVELSLADADPIYDTEQDTLAREMFRIWRS